MAGNQPVTRVRNFWGILNTRTQNLTAHRPSNRDDARAIASQLNTSTRGSGSTTTDSSGSREFIPVRLEAQYA